MPSLHQPTSECPCPTGSLQTLSIPLRHIPLPEEVTPVGAGKRVAQECHQVEVAPQHHPVELLRLPRQGKEEGDLLPLLHEQDGIIPDGALSRGGDGMIDPHRGIMERHRTRHRPQRLKPLISIDPIGDDEEWQ